MAAEGKGMPSKAKVPQEETAESSKAEDPEEMLEKEKDEAHRKSLQKKKSKGKGKKTIDDKPKVPH